MQQNHTCGKNIQLYPFSQMPDFITLERFLANTIYWPGSDERIYAAWNVLGQTWDDHVYQIPGNYTTRI